MVSTAAAVHAERQVFARIQRDDLGPCVLATVVDVKGSAPCRPGFRMVVEPDGASVGTVGGGALEKQVCADARSTLQEGSALRTYTLGEHSLGMWCGGQVTVFLEPRRPAGIVWVFGFGHIGRETAALLRHLGFTLRVVHHEADPAAEDPWVMDWSSLEPFPPVAEADRVLLLTMDHHREVEIILRLADTPPRLIGVVGSATKGARLRQELERRGTDPDALPLQIPVGLDIGAANASEVALAIAAGLVKENRHE